jgi:hypothetical protein
MNITEINDIRQPGDLKTNTFSNFKKTDVKKQLIDNLLKGKIEPACYWSAELICAGHYMDLWEIILHYVGKYIHLGNPKIVIYIQMRFQQFKETITSGHYLTELQLRNNQQIRNLFAEVISVIALSNKKNSFEPVKICREEEFDITQMSERLKAPSAKYAEAIMKKDDPKELFIAINEFAYHISSDSKNMRFACYWIEWIIEFDLICKKRKEPCYCERRPFVTVSDKKMSCDIIWIIWEVLLGSPVLGNDPFIEKLMKALLDIFSIKYTTASSKKRRYLLYFAVELLTEFVPTNIELIANKEMVKTVIAKIDIIYKQIKKNEVSPNTDYLFANVEKQNNFDESIRKIEMMNSMDIVHT